MDRLLRFLFDQPVVAMVLFFWIVGAIGNVRSIKKKREQAAQRGGGAQPPPRQPGSRPTADNAEQVAREMRRILGLDPDVPPPQPKPVPKRAPATPPRRSIERAPLPVSPTAQSRRLDLQAGSHVGESMAQRRATTSADLGSLGGRVHEAHLSRDRGSRFAMTDLKRVLVLGEILGPPVSMRQPGERLI